MTGLLALLQILVAFNALYLGVLTLGAWLARFQARPLPEPVGEPQHMLVLVAAHDEEAVIADGLASLAAQRYPAECFAVAVVADRCRDATAAIARAGGAQVFERQGAGPASKGDALRWLWAQLGEQVDRFDAVVVLDADNQADPSLLAELDRRMRQGALVVQGQRVAQNPTASPASALDGLAEAVHHRVAAAGLAFWGLSTTLSGSGAAIALPLFAWLLAGTTTLVEDCEWQLRLLSRGIRIVPAPRARLGDEKTREFATLARQRSRWIQGKLHLALRVLPDLAWRAVRLRPGGLEGLLVLATMMPRSVLVVGELGFGLLGALGVAGAWSWPVWLGLGLCVLAHVTSGLVIDGVDAREWKSLLAAPRFVGALLAACVRALGRRIGWERTPHGSP